MDIKENKEKFISIYKEKIKRDGAEELLEYLQNSDFFSAPASTKFHSAVQGGLCEHSLNVYKRFLANVKNEFGNDYKKIISDESIAIIALLHDVCKISYYKTEFRNVKEDGIWVQKPFYVVSDSLPYGHGEKSVYIVSAYIKLSREEAMSINWHMGGFDARVKSGDYTISEAFYSYPISVLFHVSDVEATYLDETRN